MKRPRKNQVIIRRQLAQPRLELSLIDKTTGLVDDDEGEYRPVYIGWNSLHFRLDDLEGYVHDCGILCG